MMFLQISFRMDKEKDNRLPEVEDSSDDEDYLTISLPSAEDLRKIRDRVILNSKFHQRFRQNTAQKTVKSAPALPPCQPRVQVDSTRMPQLQVPSLGQMKPSFKVIPQDNTDLRHFLTAVKLTEAPRPISERLSCPGDSRKRFERDWHGQTSQGGNRNGMTQKRSRLEHRLGPAVTTERMSERLYYGNESHGNRRCSVKQRLGY
nr:uncharacterized protein LOC123758954 [Procambarus clarkii]XP_045599677.1 uncharacterized protein LOC123758955 [Procambarus clarkii]